MKLDLLAQLSKHVRSGRLLHKRFDFNVVNASRTDDGLELPSEPNVCGTNGCAMGELPAVFPDTWRFGSISGVTRTDSDLVGVTAISDFFGIPTDAVFALFYPRPQHMSEFYYGDFLTTFGCRKLEQDATREQVADNIDAFIAFHR